MAHFEELSANSGFDATAAPVWLMVPRGGAKMVKLVDAAGLTVSSVNPRIADVVELPLTRFSNTRPITVRGLAKGTTFIEVKRGGALVVRMEVAVKTKVTVDTTFNLVSDNAGHSTTRGAADVPAIVTMVNDILLPQANVEMVAHDVRPVVVGQNLRQVVRFSSHLPGIRARQHEWDVVVALRDPTADFNVFFVWEYEQDRTPHRDDVDAGTLAAEANCLFEDKTGQPAGETLAHETGHLLGCADNPGAGLLMSPAGRKVPKADANTMNR